MSPDELRATVLTVDRLALSEHQFAADGIPPPLNPER